MTGKDSFTFCKTCKQWAELVTGEKIYPRREDLHELYFWECQGCGDRVGTHSNSKDHKPKGPLSNATLRKAKMRVHHLLDPLFESGDMTRDEAYQLLADLFEIPLEKCHIGWFSKHRCKLAEQFLKERIA